MKVKQLYLFLLLLIFLILPQDFAFANTSSDEPNKQALSWCLNEEGELLISGEGELPNYDNCDNIAPWASYFDQIYSIRISEGITSIGSYSFVDCNNLKEAAFPVSLVKIESDAFKNCTALSDIYYDSSSQAREAMEIDISNDLLENVCWHYTPCEHEAETIPGIPPTTTQTGLTQGVRCSLCGQVLEAQEEIPSLGFTISYVLDGAENHADNPEGEFFDSFADDVVLEVPPHTMDTRLMDGFLMKN